MKDKDLINNVNDVCSRLYGKESTKESYTFLIGGESNSIESVPEFKSVLWEDILINFENNKDEKINKSCDGLTKMLSVKSAIRMIYNLVVLGEFASILYLIRKINSANKNFWTHLAFTGLLYCFNILTYHKFQNKYKEYLIEILIIALILIRSIKLQRAGYAIFAYMSLFLMRKRMLIYAKNIKKITVIFIELLE